MTRSNIARAFLVLAAGLVPPQLAGQLAHPEPGSGARLEIGLEKPFLDGFWDDVGFASPLLGVRARLPVGGRGTLFVDMGLAHASIGSKTSTALGNLTAGLVFGDADATSGWVSLTLPTATDWGDDDFAVGYAFSADPMRLERYLPDLAAVEAGVRFMPSVTPAGSVGARLGVQVVAPTEGDADAEIFARYALFGRRRAGRVRVGAELEGYAIVSESGLDLGERTLHTVTGSIGLPEAGGAPELYVRIPVDGDLGEVLNVAVGLRMSF
ncbi:MAG TPA: hypothetical protein VK849_00740 [Longimicrobiales bacterium]|nr:hypothetical protein [Longimicrobiales bacterium]